MGGSGPTGQFFPGPNLSPGHHDQRSSDRWLQILEIVAENPGYTLVRAVFPVKGAYTEIDTDH